MPSVNRSRVLRPSRWWQGAYARLAILSAAASVLAFLIADIVPFADPIPAAITAVISVRTAFHHAAKETLLQTLGALLGAAIALVVVSVIGSGFVVIGVLVIAAFGLARFIKIVNREEMPGLAANISVTMILVVGVHLDVESATRRFTGVAIGALCALAASWIASPARETSTLRDANNKLQRDLAKLLADIATGLREQPDPVTARQWREQATDLRNRSLGLAAQLQDLQAGSRWSPRIETEEMDALAAVVEANGTMAIRALAIATDLVHAVGTKSRPSIPAAARNPLADLVAAAADNIRAEDPATSLGMTAAHEALRGADMTAQLALIGGIVSHVNRITQASAEADDAGLEPAPRPTDTQPERENPLI